MDKAADLSSSIFEQIGVYLAVVLVHETDSSEGTKHVYSAHPSRCTSLPFEPGSTWQQSADLKNYVEFLNKAYSCFLEGEDEALQGITAEFSEAREGDDAGAEDFLEKLEEANEALSQTNQEVLFFFYDMTSSFFF